LKFLAVLLGETGLPTNRGIRALLQGRVSMDWHGRYPAITMLHNVVAAADVVQIPTEAFKNTDQFFA
jgi:hypothetical protein